MDPRRDVHGKNGNAACHDAFHCCAVFAGQRAGYANSKDGIYDNSIFRKDGILNLAHAIIFCNFLLCAHSLAVFFRISKAEQLRVDSLCL